MQVCLHQPVHTHQPAHQPSQTIFQKCLADLPFSKYIKRLTHTRISGICLLTTTHKYPPETTRKQSHNVATTWGRFAPPRCGHVVDHTSDMPSYVVATLCVARCGNVRCIRCGMRLEGHAREISALRADFWRFRCPVAAATHVATLHVAAQLSAWVGRLMIDRHCLCKPCDLLVQEK